MKIPSNSTTLNTLVIGASIKPERYSNIAINMLREYDHPVIAYGLRKGTVNDVEIITDLDIIDLSDPIHTVTLYVSPPRQGPFIDWVLEAKPKRVIFNPGTENQAFAQQLEAAGIQPVFACTLVMLRTTQY